MRISGGKIVIVVTEPAYFSAAIPLLRAAGATIRVARTRRALEREIRSADGLLVRIETRVDKALLARAKRLRVVGSATTGLDHIDRATCRARGIAIRSLHGTHTVPTAEHALALLLSLVRKIPAASAAMARGEWGRERFLGRTLSGATLGVVGLGRIGTAVARRALALGMRVVACDPYVKRPRSRQIRMTTLPRLLAASDAITVHAALTDETRGLVDRAALARMRPGTVLINTARGEIVPWRDLLRALDAGRVGAAALDVHDEEPLPKSHPLRRYARAHPDRLLLTPHLGASTREAADTAAREIAGNMLRALRLGVVLFLLATTWGCGGGKSTPATSNRAPEPVATTAPQTSSMVYPVHDAPFGASYGEWSARWWQWSYGVPVSRNPLSDPTGAFASEGQNGPVWFLAGTYGIPGKVVRTCTVPEGVGLFFPILDILYFANDGDPNTRDIRNLRRWAAEGIDTVERMEAEIDGAAVPDLASYRVRSPVFRLDLPEQNIVGEVSGEGPWSTPGIHEPAVTEGIFLMLRPLPPGPHVIRFRGGMKDYSLDVTYHLTVAPTVSGETTP